MCLQGILERLGLGTTVTCLVHNLIDLWLHNIFIQTGKHVFIQMLKMSSKYQIFLNCIVRCNTALLPYWG